jgi:hypothetical protein
MKNPVVPANLSDKYLSLVDFDYDGSIEELILEKTSVEQGVNNLYINFKVGLHYISKDTPHEISAILIDDEDNEYELQTKKLNVSKFKEAIFNEYRITIPIDLIEKKNHSKINIIYNCESFTKQDYLKNNGRHSLRYDEFDLDIGIGIDRVLYIDKRIRNSNSVRITNMVLEDGNFNFEGESKKEIENIVMENVVSFKKNYYPLKYNKNKFTFTIPYNDIIMEPIKKWELKPEDLSNSISISEEFEFLQKTDRTVFKNSRKKVLIENDVYNTFSISNRVLDVVEKYELKDTAKKYNIHKILDKMGLKKFIKNLFN